MRITELLLEFEVPGVLRDIPLLTIGNSKLTVGQVSDAIPGVEPEDVVRQGKNIKDFLQSKIKGNYSVSDALIDVATLYPALRVGKVAMSARAGGGGVAKEIAKGDIRREIGQEIKKDVSVLPTLKDKDKATSGSNSVSPMSTNINPLTKKRKYKVGDKITVNVGDQKSVGIVKSVLPQGYEVAVDSGKSINIPEPLSETATAGGTSADNIASTGNSPHIAVGDKAMIKRWSGSPGKMGKSPNTPSAEPQDADDNPVTNSKVGNNLIS
jgi:hypothetical protein